MKRGRPQGLNSKVLEELTDALRDGADYELAAQAAGITGRTFHRWRKKAEGILEELDLIDCDVEGLLLAEGPLYTQTVLDITPEEAAYVDFYFRVTKAAAQGGLVHLRNVKNHSENDWKASAFVLERRYGFEKNVKHDISTTADGAAVIVLPSNERDGAQPGSTKED